MSPRQLAPGWLVALSCLSAGPAAAQAPAAATAAPAAAAASGPRAAAPGPAAAASAAAAPAPAQAASAAAAPSPAASAAAAPASSPASSPAAAAPAPAPATETVAAAPAASASPARPAARKPAGRPRAKAAAKPAATPAPDAPALTSHATPSAPSAAERAAHERELEAIRNALVDTAVAAPVRVQSFGWIDSQGRLHESSQFTSDARVRGVRVQAYLDDPQAPPPPAPQVLVDVDTLPTGVGRRAERDPAQCLARNGRWRQGLQVEAVAAPGTRGPQLLQAARAAQVLVPHLTSAGRESRRWVVSARPYQPASPYERALLGRESDTVDWLARVVVLSHGGGQLEAELQLLPQGHAAPARKLVLTLPPLEASPAVWAERMAEWIGALDQSTACDPLWFAVRGEGSHLRLREGGAHGLQAGDRLLLVQRQALAGRLLEPGAVRSIALLQVEPGSGALRWLAGSSSGLTGPAGDWVVLPL